MMRNSKMIQQGPRLLAEQELTKAGPRKHGNSGQQRTRSAAVNLAESPLSWLYARGHLSERQYEAGEQLRRDYERASLGPNITMRWDPSPAQKGRRGAPGHMEASEAQLAAKLRFEGAIDAAGRGLADICWRVICAGEALSSAEKALGWPTRSGKLVLTLALDRLADFYRIR